MKTQPYSNPILWLAVGLFLLFFGSTVVFAEETRAAPEPSLKRSGGADLGDASEFFPPDIQPGPEMTLSRVIELAEKRNLSLAAIQEDLKTAEARLQSSWSVLLPSLYGGMNYTMYDHEDRSTVNGQSVVSRSRDDLDASLTVSLPLISPRTWLNVSAAKTDRDISRLTAEDTRQALIFSVAQAFYQALTARSLIEVYRSQIDSIERHLEVASIRHRSGVGDRLDVTRAESDLISSREELIKAHFALDDARDALATLIRSGDLPLPVDDSGSDFKEIDVSSTRVVENAVDRRPDLKVARRGMELARKQNLANWMQFVPTLNASWQYAYQITDPPASQVNIDRSRWFAGLVLNVPLFDFSFFPSLGQSRSTKRKSNYNAQLAEDNARTEIRQTMRDYEKSVLLVRTARRKIGIAEESLRLSEDDFETGTGSSLSVSDSRRSLQAAQVDGAVKKLEARLAHLKLLRVMGEDLLEGILGDKRTR